MNMDPTAKINIVVHGKPTPKGRHRTAVNKRGRIQTFTPIRTRLYELKVRTAATVSMIESRADKICGPVALDIIIAMPRPQRLKGNAIEWHTCKPDASNVTKAIEDAINELVYKDDSQVCLLRIAKVYHGSCCSGLDEPCVVVNAMEINESPEELFLVAKQGEIKWNQTTRRETNT